MSFSVNPRAFKPFGTLSLLMICNSRSTRALEASSSRRFVVLTPRARAACKCLKKDAIKALKELLVQKRFGCRKKFVVLFKSIKFTGKQCILYQVYEIMRIKWSVWLPLWICRGSESENSRGVKSDGHCKGNTAILI
jgi:hypothetical protein